MRKPRILREGAQYHVSARANRQEMIMEADAMKALFEDVLARAKKKFEFRVDNFCILGNHFHLLIQPKPGTNLSSIMQWVLSVFARLWNRHHGFTGHVWGERFFSRIVESMTDFLQTFQYVDLNPVRAGLVSRPFAWRFGGAFHRVHRKKNILGEG